MNNREEHENDSERSKTGLRVLIAVMCVLIAFISIGLYMWWTLEPPLFPEVDSIEEMTLISVDGTYGESWRAAESIPSGDKFYTFPVFGEVKIVDPAERRAILSAIQQGVDEGGEYAKCFYPRHGLRLVTNEAICEYNICFECGHIYNYVNSREVWLKPTSISPQAYLNTFFEKAGIPLAPYAPSAR